MTIDWTTRRVALVCGGDSSEREVSLRTGAAFAEALRSVGVAPTVVDLRRGTLPDLIAARPDVVLIALHGRHGEDGALQGALELLGIPYTGSGVAASALAMDKVRSKCVFERFGVQTPSWTIVAPASECPPAPMDAPFVVKPALEGSSVGVTIVTDVAQWPDAWAAARGCRGDLLVEEFIAGRELTVGVFDGQPMGIVEIAPADGFYDYDAKYRRGDTRYLYPAPLSEPEAAAVCEQATRAFTALACRGVARVDIMLDSRGPQVLEVNTIPGMTETSLVPKIAAGNGVPFAEFVTQLLDAATTDDGVRP